MTKQCCNVVLQHIFIKTTVLFRNEGSFIMEILLMGNGLGLEILGKDSTFETTLGIIMIGILVEKKVKQTPFYLFSRVFGFDMCVYGNDHRSKSTFITSQLRGIFGMTTSQVYPVSKFQIYNPVLLWCPKTLCLDVVKSHANLCCLGQRFQKIGKQLKIYGKTLRLENKRMVTSGEGSRGGIVRECGIDMYILLYLKWITNKDLLYSTGNSAQYHLTT